MIYQERLGYAFLVETERLDLQMTMQWPLGFIGAFLPDADEPLSRESFQSRDSMESATNHASIMDAEKIQIPDTDEITLISSPTPFGKDRKVGNRGHIVSSFVILFALLAAIPVSSHIAAHGFPSVILSGLATVWR